MYRRERFGTRSPRSDNRSPRHREHHLKELLTFLVVSLVDNKEAISVTEREKQGKFYYHIKVAKSDMGKLLGRAGKTISCIRTVVRLAASKAGCDAVVDVLEED